MCCCGALPLPKGTIIFAAVDAVINIIIAVLVLVLSEGIGAPATVPFWIMLLMDILLLIGVAQRVTCLMVLWQIWAIIHIIYMFAVWFVSTLAFAAASWILDIFCDATTTISNGVTSVEVELSGISNNELVSEDTCDALEAVFGTLTIVLLIVPILNIYMWIVVQGCRQEINGSNGVAPGQGGMVMYPGAGQPAMVQPIA